MLRLTWHNEPAFLTDLVAVYVLQYTACAVPFARSTVNNGTAQASVCTSSLNGSYFQQYTKDNYYDDLLWAAAWMYKATGDAVRLPCLENSAKLALGLLHTSRALTKSSHLGHTRMEHFSLTSGMIWIHVCKPGIALDLPLHCKNHWLAVHAQGYAFRVGNSVNADKPAILSHAWGQHAPCNSRCAWDMGHIHACQISSG